MTGLHRRHRPGNRVATGWQTATVAALRVCPICQAAPNQSCRRWVSGKTSRPDEETAGYWKPLSQFHPERAGRQPKKPRKNLPPPEAFHSGQ